jgi:hypothetical protein
MLLKVCLLIRIFFLYSIYIVVTGGEALHTVERKVSAAADVVTTKAVEAKDATVAAVHSAAPTVEGKISAVLKL